jgi:hypothetical protein
MDPYHTSTSSIPGSNYSEIYPRAWALYKKIRLKTHRRPYIRSKYFTKDKVFLDYFWQHIREKNLPDRARRLKYYSCALDLIQNSKNNPTSKSNPNKRSDKLHRFAGMDSNGNMFFVQIQEDARGRKNLISIFPSKK